jgi:hypothetical protein
VRYVASGVVQIQNIASETIDRKVAKIIAAFTDTAPVVRGRCAVRFINLSESTSITMLNALDAPAASVPPKSVAIVTDNPGTPFEERKSAGRVVTRSSSTTRSFIRAIYGDITELFSI